MISYFGGKAKIGSWIYEFIPKHDIETYAEPFSGAFWVYLNPKLNYEHIPHIRYNDYNRHMANLYACSKDYNKLIKHIENAFKSGLFETKSNNPEEFKQFYKDLYYDFKNNPDNTFLDDNNFNIPDYDIATTYAFLITSAFNGCYPKSAGFSGVGKPTKTHKLGNLKLNAFINKLKDPKYQKKLENITSFENLDFEEFIEKYDSETTFFYLDPPYFSEDDRRADWYGVKDTFGYEAHERLSKILAKTKAKWALSYYDYPELSEWFPKDKYVWANKEFFRSSASFSENKSIKGNELLIFNYDPEVVKNDESPIKKENIKKEESDIDDFWK